MTADISKSQLEKLGRRLRNGTATPDDLRLLAGYRRSFLAPYREVIRRIGLVTPLVPSGRPAKSTASIVAKLQRQTGTLPQMQDIAGCRLVTENLREQQLLVNNLEREFPEGITTDRREKPKAGYRAVHIVAAPFGRAVEIQVRTALQDLWAQCSEQLAFSIDPSIKYGGGPERLTELLRRASQIVEKIERAEATVVMPLRAVVELGRQLGQISPAALEKVQESEDQLAAYTAALRKGLEQLPEAAIGWLRQGGSGEGS